MIVRVLPQEPNPNEKTVWDVEHMMDIEKYEANAKRNFAIVGEASFIEQAKYKILNEWKYVNNLIDVEW